ncbi:glycerophosphodiester phosphodiesterase family protein [Anaerococcus sp. AGMB00486]|uniref:Glycerophosphodiester phosphodiesterase family protein n=2 Tax=Anaerococcus TaxID=165779 RepID=A0ABX2NA68_9FIRM|nr:MULTISPECIES: glycerophosphodiester phosphodiesterase family protein [Anaerococcus]MSS77732.1 glycerophosphodiester phosphodiesterase family protein [Anaerococcus porci]NVF11587.1 glycerophosphodiester phosphodiesterase family protein [Anaerococcus faecalis]
MNISKEIYKENNEVLIKKIKEKGFLIAAHRGVWGGNIAQNTLNSTNLAYKFGTDIVEIDVGKSLDNKFFAFHTNKEKTIIGVYKDFEKMKSDEINKYKILNQLFEESNSNVEEFIEIIRNANKDIIFQVDRAERYFPEILDLLCDELSTDYLKRIMIKCSINDRNLDIFEKYQYKFMIMPILRKVDEIKILEKYSNINLIGIEVIAEDKESETFGREFIEKLKEKFNVLIQINAIKLDKNTDLYAGIDDDISLTNHPDKGWGKLLDWGCDIIQTDWAFALDKYRENR